MIWYDRFQHRRGRTGDRRPMTTTERLNREQIKTAALQDAIFNLSLIHI